MSHPSFYLNLCGVKLSDAQMEKIPAPRFELTTHVTIKSAQACGLIGCIAGSMTSAFQGQRDFQSIQDKAYQYGRTGLLTGLVLGPVSCIPFLFKSNIYLKDTCYRIRFNKNQMVTDRLSILGLAVGLGTAKYLGAELEKGAVFGFVGGFLCATVFNLGVWNPVNLAEKMNLI